ncbi:uncharacterized protein PRCAT00000628001 [Priceomyces carsonii]|uniref:uncharacterized protein n=1 Tax=Priceomyces carsonii TaxID=28549 RepID=UPI002ED94B5E|nr:unnamed protein product [Priceomyces carsonii]
MAVESHPASTTLNDIIDELKLKYDSSVGLLEGESVRGIPSLNTLLNVSKLFNNFEKELRLIEQVDEDVLNRVAIIRAKNKESVENGEENVHTKEDGVARNKRGKANDEDDYDVVDDDSSHVSKRRKLSTLPQLKREDEDNDEDEAETADSLSKENGQSDGSLPPIQTGSYTQDNDTRLKNPKSEFVPSQTLSAAAIADLGLFSEDNNGLETQGKDYLKRKYGVASYPDNDLQNFLPGKIPDVDFSKNKPPSNQVQFSTFQSYIESYFRPYTNDDLKFLNEKFVIPPGFGKTNYDPSLHPYIIPKLGQFYANAWAEEDATLGSKLNSPQYQQSLESFKPRGSIDNLSDDKLYTEEISCGPLSSRLLSAILSSHEGNGNDDESYAENNIQADDQVATQLNSGEDYKITTDSNDFYSIEERLKRELKYIGIFMNLSNTDEERSPKFNGRVFKSEGSIVDTDDWIKNKEDDEVCAEIRSLQKELKGAVLRNKVNKKKLIPLVEEQIAYQEYCTILEDLDKQVDLAYLKRLKAKNKKKKTEATPLQQQSANNGLRALLDKRKRWINNIGKLFKSPEIMKRPPETSILKGEGEDEEEEGEDEDIEDTTDQLIQK